TSKTFSRLPSNTRRRACPEPAEGTNDGGRMALVCRPDSSFVLRPSSDSTRATPSHGPAGRQPLPVLPNIAQQNLVDHLLHRRQIVGEHRLPQFFGEGADVSAER